MSNAFIPSVCLTLLLTVSCQREQTGTVIARVGNAELTYEEALAHCDTAKTPLDDQLRRYVARWVNDEMIFQEAKKNGVDKWDDVQRKIRDARRQLTAEAYLRNTIEGDTGAVDPHLLDEYYKNHASEFFVREDMIKLNLLIVQTREHAGIFAALVSRGIQWNNAVDQFCRDTASSRTIVTNIRGQFFSQHTLFPTELWKVAGTLGVNDVSFPVKISSGYGILQPLAVIREGTSASFELVQDEVRQRLLMGRRSQSYNELLGTLRARYDVEIVPGTEHSDTTQRSNHE